MKLYELMNIVTGTTKTRIMVKTDEPCEIRTLFGNIPRAFLEAKVKSISIKGLDSGMGTYEHYLEVEIIDI